MKNKWLCVVSIFLASCNIIHNDDQRDYQPQNDTDDNYSSYVDDNGYYPGYDTNWYGPGWYYGIYFYTNNDYHSWHDHHHEHYHNHNHDHDHGGGNQGGGSGIYHGPVIDRNQPPQPVHNKGQGGSGIHHGPVINRGQNNQPQKTAPKGQGGSGIHHGPVIQKQPQPAKSAQQPKH